MTRAVKVEGKEVSTHHQVELIAKRPYITPECTAWGSVVDLTEGLGGGAMDLGATSMPI